MQPPTEAPRSAYTADQITALIRDTSDVEIGAGLELIDRNLETVEDLTSTFLGGTVERDSYATLHGKASLVLSRQLDWGQSIVRPYSTLDGVKFYHGAYFTDVPTWDGTNVFSVAGHDILEALADRVGAAYGIDAGDPILATVEGILQAQGFLRYVIDPARADAAFLSDRVWPLDDNTTWLTIVNDMLAAVGYAGVWSDWMGQPRCQPYIAPRDRGSEWVYYGEGEASQLPVDRSAKQDLYAAPNRWIAVRQNNIEGATPVEGDGVFTFINADQGPTSVEARGNRTITAPLITVDAADQAALEAAVAARAAADMANPVSVELSLPAPGNPLHWHFDRVYVVDPDLGLAEVLVTKWTLPLAPSTDDMSQTWTVLDA